jgi:hypothetical protein
MHFIPKTCLTVVVSYQVYQLNVVINLELEVVLVPLIYPLTPPECYHTPLSDDHITIVAKFRLLLAVLGVM